MSERRLDVFLAPGEVAAGDLAGRPAVVIDVLRASTSIVEALAAGARAIFPVASVEEASRLANTLGRGEVLLACQIHYRALPMGPDLFAKLSARHGAETRVLGDYVLHHQFESL